MNIRFEYLYRDAGNNKKWGDVVFLNESNVDLETLKTKLGLALISGEFFVAESSHLPKIGFDSKSDLDHDWYEFDGLSTTSDAANDPLARDILQFVSSTQETSEACC